MFDGLEWTIHITLIFLFSFSRSVCLSLWSIDSTRLSSCDVHRFRCQKTLMISNMFKKPNQWINFHVWINAKTGGFHAAHHLTFKMVSNALARAHHFTNKKQNATEYIYHWTSIKYRRPTKIPSEKMRKIWILLFGCRLSVWMDECGNV